MGSVISDRWSESDRKLLRLCKKKKRKRRADGQCNLRSMDQREIESFFVYVKKKKKKRRADGQCNLRSMDQREIESFFVYV